MPPLPRRKRSRRQAQRVDTAQAMPAITRRAAPAIRAPVERAPARLPRDAAYGSDARARLPACAMPPAPIRWRQTRDLAPRPARQCEGSSGSVVQTAAFLQARLMLLYRSRRGSHALCDIAFPRNMR